MEYSVDFGHVLVVIDYRTGIVRCQVPGKNAHTSTPRASWGSAEYPAGLDRPRGPWNPAAGAALAVVFSIKRAGSKATAMHRLTAAIRTLSSTCLRPATHDQATAAVLAVRRAAWNLPGRTACLEESTAVVILLAMRRLGVTWCHGIAPDPVRLHAWVRTWDGGTAAEPDSTNAYTPALTIGEPRGH